MTERLPTDCSRELRTVCHSALSEKSQTSLSYEPVRSVCACVCYTLTADTANQRDHDRLYTVHYYFCMIYLKLKKNWNS